MIQIDLPRDQGNQMPSTFNGFERQLLIGPPRPHLLRAALSESVGTLVLAEVDASSVDENGP